MLAVFNDPTKKKSMVPASVANAVTMVKPSTSLTPVPTAPMGGIMDTQIAKNIQSPVQAPGMVGGVVTAPTKQEGALAKYGGQDAYIKSQLERFKTGGATLQGKINKDLSRFGVKASPITGRPDQAGFGATSLQGATIGSENGGSFFQLPDGSREWIDTPEEQSIADEINRQNSELGILQAGQTAQQEQGRADLEYSLQDLGEQEALARQQATDLQGRFGGLYSGGLRYQLGNLDRTYGRERGRLQNNYDIANRQLQSQYGAQVDTIKKNINNLLSSAPAQINSAISAAAASKRDANMKAAEDFYKTYGYAVKPQDDYSGFWRQVASGQAGLGQKEQLELDKFTVSQQKDLVDNLWKAADQTGVISKALADLYPGVLKSGQQTRAAREFASQQNLRQDSSDLAWIREERLQNSGSSSKAEEGTYLDQSSAKEMFRQSLTVEDPNGAEGDTMITKDKTARANAVAELFDSGLVNPKDMADVLAGAGFTATEINALKKASPESFQSASSRSDGGTSMGPPSPVRLEKGVSGNAPLIDQYARQYGVDPALLKAIIYHETGNMTSNAAKNKNNFGGLMRSKGGLQSFDTPEKGIEAVASLLGRKYKGKTISQIGAIYAPVGASNDPNNMNAAWVRAVTKLYNQFS